MSFPCWRWLLSLVVVTLLLKLGCSQENGGNVPDPQDPVSLQAMEIRQLTGAPTRIVWLQDTPDRGTDYLAWQKRLRMMGLDTEDGLGARVLLEAPRNMVKPMFTASGDWIIFSDRHEERIHALQWGRDAVVDLGPGFGLTTWVDPETGTEWLYLARERVPGDAILPAYLSMYRYPLFSGADLHHPHAYSEQTEELLELVWDRTPVSEDSFQISTDGRYASAAFPWPEVGVLDLETRRWTRLGQGCWVAMSPDDSYHFWVFDGPHRNVTMFRADHDEQWAVNVNNAPGMDGYEVYHPRWSNHPQIFAVTGPYKVGEGSYRLPGGGAEVKVHLGRFNAARTQVEAWVEVSDDSRADFYPDVWVRPDPEDPVTSGSDLARSEDGSDDGRLQGNIGWPSDRNRLAYVWEHAAGLHDIADVVDGSQVFFRPEPRLLARYDRHHAMRLHGGFFIDDSAGKHLQRFAPLDAMAIEFSATQAPSQPLMKNSWVFAVLKGDKPLLVIFSSQGQWRLQGSDTNIALMPVNPGQPIHIAVSYASGRLEIFVDGEPAAAIDMVIDLTRAMPATQLFK
jgi:hypothetical protein